MSVRQCRQRIVLPLLHEGDIDLQGETPEALQVVAARRTPLGCYTARSPLPRKRITKKTTCQHVPHGELLHDLPTCTPQNTDTGSATTTSASPEAGNVHGVLMRRPRNVRVRERMGQESNVADHKDPNSSKFIARRLELVATGRQPKMPSSSRMGHEPLAAGQSRQKSQWRSTSKPNGMCRSIWRTCSTKGGRIRTWNCKGRKIW